MVIDEMDVRALLLVPILSTCLPVGGHANQGECTESEHINFSSMSSVCRCSDPRTVSNYRTPSNRDSAITVSARRKYRCIHSTHASSRDKKESVVFTRDSASAARTEVVQTIIVQRVTDP